MVKINKKLRICALALGLGLGGCNDYRPQYLEGKVTKECGRVVNSKSCFGESVDTIGNIGSDDYNLVVETDKGTYLLNVYSETYGKSSASLAQEIEAGSRIRFQTNYQGIAAFEPKKKGSVPASAIEVLKGDQK